MKERFKQDEGMYFDEGQFEVYLAKKEKHPINENICSTDPEAEADYIKYSKQMNFTCGVKATL